MKSTALYFLILSTFFSYVAANWDHTISVGFSDSNLSLNEALKQLQHNSTLILINTGNHTLQPGAETMIKYMTNIAITGVNKTTTIIQCQPNAGLSFHWSSSILLQNITINECNMQHNSTSRDYSNVYFAYLVIESSVFFLFCNNVTINRTIIHDSPGYGLILYNTVGMNRITESDFVNNGRYPSPSGGGVLVEFSYCVPGDLNCPSQGSSSIDQALVSNSKYIIESNSFENNIASPGIFTNLDPIPIKGRDYFGLGRGGGLSLVFKGNSQNNLINLYNSNFRGNIAQYGGCLFVAFDDKAHGNIVLSELNGITQCAALIPGSSDIFVPSVAEGGGTMFLYGSEDNTISINSTTLDQNSAASYGGAVSVHSLITTESPSPGKLTFTNVRFESNSAKQGAAMYFLNVYPSSKPSVMVSLSDCDWYNNRIDRDCNSPSNIACSGTIYTNAFPMTLSGLSTTFLHNTGSPLDVHQTTVTISSQTITFTNNIADNGGAIHLANCGKLIISNDINLFFGGNQALYSGAAIYESGCKHTLATYTSTGPSQCFIQNINRTLHPDNWNTNFFFNDNFAGTALNAIYTDSLLPCVWMQSGSILVNKDDVMKTFCWKRWNYDEVVNCHDLVALGPAYLNDTAEVMYTGFNVLPGQPFPIFVKAYSNYGIEQNEEVKICLEFRSFGSLNSHYSDDSSCVTAWTNDQISVTLYAKPNSRIYQCDKYEGQQAILSVEAVKPPHPKLITYVNFDQCPFYTSFKCPQCHLNLDQSYGLKCVDSQSCELTQSTCYLNASLTTSPGHCWNVDSSINIGTNASTIASLIGGPCPYAYSDDSLPCGRISEFSSTSYPTMCPGNREGRLCGRCTSGYSWTANTIDHRCIKCYGLGWPLQLGLEITFITILIVVIVALSISLNAGGTNAFLFFTQIVTLKYPGLSYPSWVFEPDETNMQYNNSVVKGFTLLYSISNFDIVTPLPLPPFCLSNTITPIQALALDFIPALYPLLVLTILYVWIALYSYHFKPVYTITQALSKLCQCHRNKYRPSLLDSFATIVLICYSRIAATCFKFFHPSYYYNTSGEWLGTAFYYDGTLDYFGKGHAEYTFIAMFLIIVFLLIPAFFLLLHPCIHRYHERRRIRHPRTSALASTFNRCFKDGSQGTNDLRFFAGVYLLLRIAIRIIYLIHTPKVILALELIFSLTIAIVFMTVRPYKNDVFNHLDAIIFLFLTLLAGLSAAGYAYVCYKGLIYLPLAVILAYGLYRLCNPIVIRLRKSKWKHTYRQVPTNDSDSSSDDDEAPWLLNAVNMTDLESNDSSNTEALFADRLLNPQQYRGRPDSSMLIFSDSHTGEQATFHTHSS